APYVFTSLERARTALVAAPDQASYLLVRLTPGADAAAVRRELAARLASVDVLTPAEFASRSLSHWLFSTGARAALPGGALLAVVVGIVIVAQPLYASTKDHLPEFATLRALGSSTGYINKVILVQALVSGTIGYIIAVGCALVVVVATADTALPMVV